MSFGGARTEPRSLFPAQEAVLEIEVDALKAQGGETQNAVRDRVFDRRLSTLVNSLSRLRS